MNHSTRTAPSWRAGQWLQAVAELDDETDEFDELLSSERIVNRFLADAGSGEFPAPPPRVWDAIAAAIGTASGLPS
jgi:hypothetical protein